MSENRLRGEKRDFRSPKNNFRGRHDKSRPTPWASLSVPSFSLDLIDALPGLYSEKHFPINLGKDPVSGLGSGFWPVFGYAPMKMETNIVCRFNSFVPVLRQIQDPDGILRVLAKIFPARWMKPNHNNCPFFLQFSLLLHTVCRAFPASRIVWSIKTDKTEFITHNTRILFHKAHLYKSIRCIFTCEKSLYSQSELRTAISHVKV